MRADTSITKTIWQYSETLPEETMLFLKGIASDYCKVKNYVYGRYAGIKNLNRLISVYDILNQMRHCGLREQLNLPVVYYELAIAEAVADIKSRWGTVRNRINDLISQNENLTNEERMYLRTVLKINRTYAAVLNRQAYEMPKNVEGMELDIKRLNNLLCRLTRRHLTALETDNTSSFRISPNGYSYKQGAISIVCRIPRKRISIPLRDNRRFDRQIQIHIKENYAALAIPIEVKKKVHKDYTGTVYVHIGSRDMFTLSNGNIYGAALENLTNPETERLAKKNRERYRMYTVCEKSAGEGNCRKAENIRENNLGKYKYDRQKQKEKGRTTTYINAEINRMFRVEKPEKIVISRPVTKNKTRIYVKSVNRQQTRSFNGYIRERLAYKCRVHSIALEEISSAGIGKSCAMCGAEGKMQGKEFLCEKCGLRTTTALNSAKSIQQKYNDSYVQI